MAIPGYDSSNVAEYTLESAGARVAVVAGVVPDEFDLAKSGREPPVDALADPVDLVALDDLKAVEAVRIALVYDPRDCRPARVRPTSRSPSKRKTGGSHSSRRWI